MLTLLLGPVGAGKTTFGLQLAGKESSVFFNLDEWMTTLFRPDRPENDLMLWYESRSKRCKSLICSMAERSLNSGLNVILEIGLIRHTQRQEFFNWLDSKSIDSTIYIFDVERSVRRERVQQRNQQRGASYSMDVPLDFFELASDMWEPVLEQELTNRKHFIL